MASSRLLMVILLVAISCPISRTTLTKALIPAVRCHPSVSRTLCRLYQLHLHKGHLIQHITGINGKTSGNADDAEEAATPARITDMSATEDPSNGQQDGEGDDGQTAVILKPGADDAEGGLADDSAVPSAADPDSSTVKLPPEPPLRPGPGVGGAELVGDGASHTQANATIQQLQSNTRDVTKLTAVVVNEHQESSSSVSLSGGLAVAGNLKLKTPFGTVSVADTQAHTLNRSGPGPLGRR